MKTYLVSNWTQERGFRASPVYPKQEEDNSRTQELIARAELGHIPITDLPGLIGETAFQEWFDKKYPRVLRPKF